MDREMEVRQESLRGDLLGGVVIALAMSYIFFVHPQIMAGAGVPVGATLTSTVLLAFTMTMAMGVYARLPFGVAPGMGVNAYFVFTLVQGYGMTPQQGFGVVALAGVLFLLASFTSVRRQIVDAIPESLRYGTSIGIGVFLFVLGLKNAGFVVVNPAVGFQFAGLHQQALLAVLGVALIGYLEHRRNNAAYLIGIFAVTGMAVLLGMVEWPESILSFPDFSLIGSFDLRGALTPAHIAPIVGIFFTDLFDSLSTFIGVATATGLVVRGGAPRNLKQGLIVDAFATLGAGVLGTSSGTAFVESAAGIGAGARTGRAAIVAAFLFLPFLFVAPLAGLIPACATAPVLLLIGLKMFSGVRDLRHEVQSEYIPAAVTALLIPLTFSITQGILWGFIAHTAMKTATLGPKGVKPTMWILTLVAITLIAIETLQPGR